MCSALYGAFTTVLYREKACSKTKITAKHSLNNLLEFRLPEKFLTLVDYI